MTGMLAEITALHGDVDAARALLDTLEAAAGDNPYRITVWATMAARIAAFVGDPAWRCARRSGASPWTPDSPSSSSAPTSGWPGAGRWP